MVIHQMNINNVTVGNTAIFKHRLSPGDPIIEEAGQILSTGVTSDAKFYVEASVGSHTKKFILSQ